MKDIKALKHVIQKLRYILSPKRRRQCIILFLVIFAGALFELLGVTAILPFIQAILQPESLMNNQYIEPVIKALNIQSEKGLVILLGIGIILLYVLKNVVLLFSSYVQTRFRNGLQKEMSTKLLESMMKRPYTYYLDVNSGDLIRGLTGDVDSINSILNSMFSFLVEGLCCALVGVYILLTDIMMAVGVLTIAIICFVAVTISFKRKMAIAGKKQRWAMVEKNIYAYQAITGIKEIMVAQKNDFFVSKYRQANEKVRETSILYDVVKACPERIIEATCIGGIICMVCIRIAVGIDPKMFIPQLGAFAVAAFRILPSISRMIGDINNVVFLQYSLGVVYNDFLETEKYAAYVKEYNKIHASEKVSNGGETIRFKSEIEIQKITWRYPNAHSDVLSELSLKIQRGDAIGLIGASGAGKTTLADTLLGLLRPQKGAIYMDGIDILTMPAEWSKIIGYVPQTVFLTDDTIRNNVTFGIEKEKISDKLVWNALEQAQMKNFVEQLPDQLDTVVGERGIKFSGGQRQRIAIARALYSNPDILVLDEATSALDNETENAVMEAIDLLQGHKTLIIVAHRLTTIRNCNKIYEIKDGKAFLQDKEKILSN